MAPRGTSGKQMVDNVKAHSRPSELRITDVRVAVDENHGEGPAPIVRIDTNQGISGYGQARNGSSKTYILMLKGRLLGENPCEVDRLFRKIKQFGGHARQGGGVSAVEVALWDLAGKAYGVPVYQLLGGKFRNRVRVYSDTPWCPNPREMGQRLRARMARGFTFLKMDLGIQQLKGIPDTVVAAKGMLDARYVMQPLRQAHLTDKGIEALCQYVEEVRAVVGYEIPLAVDTTSAPSPWRVASAWHAPWTGTGWRGLKTCSLILDPWLNACHAPPSQFERLAKQLHVAVA